jgi:hypothetical protein
VARSLWRVVAAGEVAVNIDRQLLAMRDLIQVDVASRGLGRDPVANLFTACPEDFTAACRNLATTPHARVKVITGFFIPYGKPPAAETDGPLGAVFLARALVPLGIEICLETDAFCVKALATGLEACGLSDKVPVVSPVGTDLSAEFTHLIALERCGPSVRDGRCYTMRGVDISDSMGPAHLAFEAGRQRVPRVTTIGIGDGGNEIGMGKISQEVIGRNIQSGDLIACRVATDFLIVAGVSNWGAYALAAGVGLLMARPLAPELFAVEREREILGRMVENGPLVDGVTGKPTVTVDGLEFDRYAEPLRCLARLANSAPLATESF